MSRRTLITIVLIVLAILIGFFGYFLYTSRGGGTGLGNLFPFGNTTPSDRTPSSSASSTSTETSGGGEQGGAAATRPRLTEISSAPVSGMVVFTKSGDPVVRYIERETGHAYEYDLDTGTTTRISNTTVTQIQEAFLNSDGTRAIDRFLQGAYTVKSFTLPLSASSTVGDYLDDGISFMAPSPDRKSVFYLENADSDAAGFTSDFAGKGARQVFTSPLHEWLPEWPTKGTIALTTKASAYAPGYLYFLSLSSGDLTRVLGDIAGLTTTVSPDGDHILYASSANILTSASYVVRKGQSIPLPVATLPEKCAWSRYNSAFAYCGVPTTVPQTALPDSWYQGLFSFTDALWMINTETGQTVQVVTPQNGFNGRSFDMDLPQMADYDQYFVFENKSDGTLWAWRIYDDTQVEAMKAAQKPPAKKTTATTKS